MTRSFFDRAPYYLVPHRSHSYFGTDEGVNEQRFDFDTGITVSNGGLNAPLGDMAKYLAFLIDGGETILKRSSLDEMFTPQIRAADGEGGERRRRAGGTVVLHRAARRNRAGRAQRRSERLHLASVLPPAVAIRLHRLVQHRRRVEARRAAHDARRRQRPARCDRARVLVEGGTTMTLTLASYKLRIVGNSTVSR